MPVTPVHLGPGILIKAVFRSAFSLVIFGYAQVLIDLQPLVVLVTHRGTLHGWSHTLIGAAVIGVVAAVTGRPLANAAFRLALGSSRPPVRISWRIAFGSALVGTFSHILLDAFIYSDVHALRPWSNAQPLLGTLTPAQDYVGCVLAGVVGTALYAAGTWWERRRP